ncbi:MAG: hypothetical protein C4327_12665 [Meiothermus sp.]
MPEKRALFMPVLLPQLVDPARGGPAAQMLAPGALFTLLALLSDGVGSWLQRNPRCLRRQK